MKILHFTGQGYGEMEGIDEYVVVIEDSGNVEEQRAPNFILESETEIEDLPSSFPFNFTLIKQ